MGFCIVSLEKSFQKLVLRVSSGFQTLENNKTTRPAASWFQMFSRVWKPDETLALVFEIVPLVEWDGKFRFSNFSGRKLLNYRTGEVEISFFCVQFSSGI